MITIEQLKDWNNVKAREDLEQKIEDYIDSEIKRQVLSGKKEIKISTGVHGIRDHYRSDFYELWCNEKISSESLYLVKQKIIEKHREIGLEVKIVTYDEGWHSIYQGLQIVIPNELLEVSEWTMKQGSN